MKIVVLGGQLDPNVIAGTSKEKYLPFHTSGDAKALYGANSADILLTSIWPASIRKGSKIELPEGAIGPAGKDYISDLCATLKPRYHFSASDFFFEREPFFHSPSPDAPDVKAFTRFISIATYGNPVKQKALYAFTLQASVDQTLPQGTTVSPFISRAPRGSKRQPLDPEPYSRYVK